MGVGSIKAAQAGTMSKLKKTLKESTGGDKWFYRLKADTDITVRFMTEPFDFISYKNHYQRGEKKGEDRSFPCNDGDCLGCDEGIDVRTVWVAPVVDVTDSRVRVMVLPKGIVDSLVLRYEKRGTIMDRDYLIMREGSTMEDTKYEIDPEAPKKRDMSAYKMPDIMAMLEEQLADAMGNADDDDEPPRRAASKRPVKKASKAVASRLAKRRTQDDDDEDDDPGFSGRPAKAIKRSTGAARKPLRKPAPEVKKKGLRR